MVTTPMKVLRVKCTANQWSLIEQKIEGTGKPDLSTFLRSEILKLKKQHLSVIEVEEINDSDFIEKRPHIPASLHEDLKKIANRMKLKPSQVIDQLIIHPIIFQQEKQSEKV